MDGEKVEAIENWPTPTIVRALRGFLGLASYYRKLVKEFGIIAALLTRLLRKNAFVWIEETYHSFKTLKKAMTSTPVLALPKFFKPFVVEYDASEDYVMSFINTTSPSHFTVMPWPNNIASSRSMKRS